MYLLKTALVTTSVLLLTGCASLINSASSRMADNLTLAMLNQADPETVRSGMPAYLLMIDGFIEGSPQNPDLLLTGSKLNASYTSAFVSDEDRARGMADKSLAYARTALCIEIEALCSSIDGRPAEFGRELAEISLSDLPMLYGFASAWANWIQVNQSDWVALAQLPKLAAMFEHCLQLDEGYDDGGAHIYLGVLNTQLPPIVGGKPEQGRVHFERAIEISTGKNLMIKVLMAENYARMVFDQELHDQLLQTVIDQPAESPGLTLINTLAKQQAKVLLAESAEFF